jgi:hypothetical protein
MRPIFGHHRAVECYEAGHIRKISKQCGQVAVAYKNLSVRLDLLQIQRWEQIVRSVPATRTSNRPYVVAGKHFLELVRTALHGPGEIEILLKDGIKIERTVASAPQGLASRLQIVALDVAGRRYNAHGIAQPESGRLEARNCRGRHAARSLL